MTFYNYFREIIAKEIERRDTLRDVTKRIEDVAKKGRKIAFFPASRLTAILLKHIKGTCPDVLEQIVGCFSRSNEATTEAEVTVYPLSELDSSRAQLLVVGSNTFKSKEEEILRRNTNYRGEKIHISYFHISLPEDMENTNIIKKIDQVYELLADKKSRATYMMAWLSKMLNDQSLTHLFESEEEIDKDSEPTVFRGCSIKDLDHTCKKELHSELYTMKHVRPKTGDVVLDLGAYKGDTSIFFALNVGRNGKVYAFEPVETNLKMLRENVRSNGLEEIVIPVNAGVSSQPGIRRVLSDSAGSPWAFIGNKGQEIRVTTVDEFVKSRNLAKVDYIKIDVEGLEKEVIEGAQETIQRMYPKMAIAAYHKTNDLITLPLMLDEIGDYTIYMRSKVEGPFGFTFYAKK